jgi:hypothetical protein
MDRIDTQPQCLLPNKLADFSIKTKRRKVDNHVGILVGRAPRKTILNINKTAVRGSGYSLIVPNSYRVGRYRCYPSREHFNQRI